MNLCIRHEIFLCALLSFLVSCAHQLPQQAAERPFQFSTDHFGFANETVWHYANGGVSPEDTRANPAEPKYSRRCFVLARSAVQFWKFARFNENLPRPKKSDLPGMIRAVTERDVWQMPLPPEQRVVFGGYRDLYDLSQQEPQILESNLGLGWPTYFRPGNYTIVFPPTRGHQERTDEELKVALSKHYPTVLWLINFPSLSINHAVVVFSVDSTPSGDRFLVYDPNDSDKPQELFYDRDQRSFYFAKTFYFKGGKVDVRPVYLSPFQ